MATVVTTPVAQSDAPAISGAILGVILAVVIGALLFIYALPYLRNGMQSQVQPGVNIQGNIPLPQTSGNENTNPSPTPNN